MNADRAAHTVIDSPIGPLTLVSVDGVLRGIYMVEHRHQPNPAAFGERATTGFDEAVTQLTEYFDGRRTEFTVPLAARGTPFQQRVWDALRTIPYGETWTYGQLADSLGTPTAIRAVAAANGRNPISIIVPCHRVIGSNGNLTGYAGGLERKRFLLEREAERAGLRLSR
ncbi:MULTISPECIES: methylated-DNA--[protein]-cysteine S-methyltransferase [Rhodococcus]|uniref:Methylated-DNA--protein-cysteine methyltransferase n=1 Tax=Rhodococcus opacus RKJ300 = JCM 13270 TaxID=1165867 RepID=I0WWU8_RHOOP|nr:MULTISPECIES: methylated-DNA--[protein]-cysteine S-methyltransferase [Rhodococcus]EID80864.1 methylated-DNA--protein-cysteine methyltransferase [Rhodococcus opacus RKJ300 = JCM 13270]QQZ15164.1 methylated-DNA--[protein]-cysteine S-methyltransferase [Rhodococcus sp. 21391]